MPRFGEARGGRILNVATSGKEVVTNLSNSCQEIARGFFVTNPCAWRDNRHAPGPDLYGRSGGGKGGGRAYRDERGHLPVAARRSDRGNGGKPARHRGESGDGEDASRPDHTRAGAEA